MKKKLSSFISFAACTATALSAMPFAVNAQDGDVIYGTMNIPYADFYASELAGSANEYEVDAVSSATTSKWSKNGEGELFEGTYNEANPDGTGTILGVTYPVAITQAELDSLGSDNYGFTPLDSEPAAYKIVTIENGKAAFSAVQDSSPVVITDAVPTITTESPWGDYVIDVKGTPDGMGAIYGAVLRTESGESYAMRHEENIWRGEFAWSSGFKTSEPHGNTLSYENFVGLMGETITEIVYITADGYITVNTSLYVPVKFSGNVSVSDSSAGTGKTTVTIEGFPDDYVKEYSVDGLAAEISDAEISYSNALPGKYTLKVSDKNGIYADVSASFVLSTDEIPAVYSDNRLVKANGVDDTVFSNYIKNIASVSVNGTSYSATGKGSTKIIGDDGTIDFTASSRDGNVFDGSGTYTVSVVATGYNIPLEFIISNDIDNSSETVTTTVNTTTNSVTTTTKATTTNSTTTAKQSTSDSPKTGVGGVAIPGMLLAAAAVTAGASRKKNK